MPDMLVKLYDLPDEAPALARSHAFGVEIRRAMAPDRQRVLDWVRTHSGDCAAGECAVSFAHTPIGCWIATRGSEIVGYACYDATAPDFFGPTRVLDSEQGHGVGTALLLRPFQSGFGARPCAQRFHGLNLACAGFWFLRQLANQGINDFQRAG